MQNKKELIRGYALFLIGLFIASMGVAFSTKAGLGTSPVASVPYSVSLVSKLLTLGGLAQPVKRYTDNNTGRCAQRQVQLCGDRCADSSCVCVWLSNKPLRLADKRNNCQRLSYAVCFYAAGLCDTCSRYLDTAQGRCGYAAGRSIRRQQYLLVDNLVLVAVIVDLTVTLILDLFACDVGGTCNTAAAF